MINVLGGSTIAPSRLGLPRSRQLATAVQHHEWATLVECRVARANVSEMVVFDLEVERPQSPVHDIRAVESIAVVFTRTDDSYPIIYALRCDFPLVPHLNVLPKRLPRSLCLYDEPWSEVRMQWTALKYLESIRQWLTLTARGELHQEDQPLEPLLLSSGFHLVIPHKLYVDVESESALFRVVQGCGGALLATLTRECLDSGQAETRFLTLAITAPTVEHGIIAHTPSNLAELAELTQAIGFDIIESIGKRLSALEDRALNKRLIVLVRFPKRRRSGTRPETTEFKAFITRETVLQVGKDIGLWEIVSGTRGGLIARDPSATGKNTSVEVANVIPSLSLRFAAYLNGQDQRSAHKIVAIGAGALGSQIAMNLARSAFGSWTVVDEDVLMPHNTTRHALGRRHVGAWKATQLAEEMNSVCDDDEIASGISTNILDPPDSHRKRIQTRLSEAEVILDMSASVAVSRHLAYMDSPARRISLFLNPRGTDLVILAEGNDRVVQLDHLEMQYYWALTKNRALSDHLSQESGKIRYGNSCRDVSSRIPQEFVGTLAGIAAGAIRQVLCRASAAIRLWRCNPVDLSVSAIELHPEKFLFQEQGTWSTLVAPSALSEVHSLRRNRLPSETGGVLVGSVDNERRIVYVLGVIPSPPDSTEWPTCYIRGVAGLKAEVERILRVTGGNLTYVGEWHSHPDDHEVLPSNDDQQVFSWIGDQLALQGQPPVMLIAGGRNQVRLFVESIDGQPPRPLSLS